MIRKSLWAASAMILVVSCKPELDVPAPQKGSLNVTKYVAIGNSMSAGYSDNALYHEAQIYSYPNLLAQQFRMIGGGEFKQPLVPANSVGIGNMQNARYVLAPSMDCAGVTSLMPTFAAAEGDISIFTTSVAANGPFNNMAIPGVKATTALYPGYGDYTQGAGNFNPFYTRVSTDPSSTSILGDAAGQQPTFFSVSIGNDDVMGYAMSGGVGDVITPSAGAPGFGFDASVDAILGTLTAQSAKGVVANIPSIHSLPYFNTVPYNGLMLDAANAAGLSAAYAALGISFTAGANGFMIEDASAPGGMRKAIEGEMILLSVPQDSLKCAGWGSMKPIPNQYVLNAAEIAQADAAITAYNTKLQATATALGLAYVDVNAFLARVRTGVIYNGVAMNATFVQGGVYSLDGIHLTPKGNAMLANEFIRAINSKYGSTIPEIDATSYKGVVFP
jgi:hypothetical protein